MLGFDSFTPLNLLLVGTLVSYLFPSLSDASFSPFRPRPLLWLYIVPILVAGALGSRHLGDIPLFFNGLVEFDNVAGYFRELVVKPLLIVIFALLVGAAWSKAEKPEKFLIPMLISIWVMGSMVIVFVYLSGVTLGELASSTSREFLSPLGMHANELGRMHEVAYALLLFTWAESKEWRLRFVLLASLGLVVVALMLTFSRGAFPGFLLVIACSLSWP